MEETKISGALPTLFIPHGGGPCFFMDWTVGPPDTWRTMAQWLGQLGDSIGALPKAVLVISGHWEEAAFKVTASSKPPLLYDYHGFPKHTYALEYPAPGSPTLAREVVELLAGAGLTSQLDEHRGLDHGVFIPFKLIYPQANIPIVALSLKAGLDPLVHLRAGAALSPLRRAGVLIVGSGMSYHNLRGPSSGSAQLQSEKFDKWLTGAVSEPDTDIRLELLEQWTAAPHARNAHPREEHLMPLMVVAGAAGSDPGKRIYADSIMGIVVSAYQFGPSLQPIARAASAA